MLVSLDYAAQELRVLGHMEGGTIQQGYIDNPKLDMHQFAAELVSSTIGKPFSRKYAKTVAFSILYGSGLTALAAGLSVTVDQAQEIRTAYLNALPGIATLQSGLKSRARDKRPIRTWGGRVYYCEQPKFVEGRWRTFDYKLLNYLVQGSSADLTKQALIDYHYTKQQGRILLTVHDQIVISCPKASWVVEANILREAMEGQALDAPLIADISYGPNLHNVEDFNG
jgi:DNA polymerase-1